MISNWQSSGGKSRSKRYIGWVWSTAYFRVFLEGKRNQKGISGKETKLACPNFPWRKNKLEGRRGGKRNRRRGLSALGFGIFGLLSPFKSSSPFDRLRIEKWRSLVALSARLKSFWQSNWNIEFRYFATNIRFLYPKYLKFSSRIFRIGDFCLFQEKIKKCFSFFFKLATVLIIFKERREYRLENRWVYYRDENVICESLFFSILSNKRIIYYNKVRIWIKTAAIFEYCENWKKYKSFNCTICRESFAQYRYRDSRK